MINCNGMHLVLPAVVMLSYAFLRQVDLLRQGVLANQ